MARHASRLFYCLLAVGAMFPVAVPAQSLSDYTASPVFVSAAVSPNILFIVDLSEGMLRAAYGSYPESSGGKISSNVNGTGLCNTNTTTSSNAQPSGCPSATASADTFDSTKTYFGMFNPLRCYTYASNEFGTPVEKATVNSNCSSTQWDGNFLNWLSMRQIDLAKKVLIGGRTLSASNEDGTANALLGEPKTGSDGSTGSCNNTTAFCFRYVKQASGSGNRYPSSLPKDAGNVTYFGSGEGTIFVSSTVTETDVFGASPSNQYAIKVDLTTETDAVRQAQSLGLLQTLRTDNMRVGVMFTNSSNGKAATLFRSFDGTFNASAITGIRNQSLSQYAALAEGTYEGLCYYRNSQGACYSNSPADFTASVGAAGDPFYFVSMTQTVSCCKSFILMISGGVPTGDGGLPDAQQPFGDLFTTDTVGVTTSRLDDVAFYGQTHDIRNQSSGQTGYVSGTQKVTFYAVNAMGGSTGSTLLASAAKYGGFTDKDSDGSPDATGQSCTYPSGSSLGSGTSTSSAEWDSDQDCIPDTYFEASEGSDLQGQIEQAIADILTKSASGTSVSVLANSSTGDGSLFQAFFFPSTFEGLNEVKWIGYIQGLFVDEFGNVREDTNADGKLVYANDNIIQTTYDTSTGDVVVSRYADSDGDGKADSATPFETTTLKDVKPIWEAGKQLAFRSASDRTIMTWVDSDNDGVVDSGEQIAFTTANATTLSPYLRASSTGTNTATNIIDFIRGTQVTGMRDREISVPSGSGTTYVWKLGDPIHSTPTVVGAPKERFDVIYGDSTYGDFFAQYKNRRLVAYAGANDGMMHGFNAGFFHKGDNSSTSSVTEHGYFTTNATDNSSGVALGTELWGFIPYQLLPQLLWLTQTDYTHVYYVDMKPKVTDARIFSDDSTHPEGWGTILIGGFRMGGSCGTCVSSTGAPPMSVTASFGGTTQTRIFYSAYFVIDITNPEDPYDVSTGSGSYGKLLWSFSQSDLGLTTSYPALVRANPSTSGKTDNTSAKWFVVFGSGPTGYDGSSTQTAKMYIIDLKTGPIDASTGASLVKSFSTGDANAFMGDAIALDANLDFRVDTSYAGNVISNGASTPSWIGKMYRLTTNNGNTDPTTWGVASGSNRAPTVVLSTFPSAGSLKVGPITAASTVTADDQNKFWIFFGTGRYFSSTDKTNSDTQYFFGVKDLVISGGCTQTSTTNCEKKDLVNVSDASVCVVCASGTDQVTGVEGVTTFEGTATTTLQGLVQSKDGWYTTLPTSRERDISTPIIIGGTVFFPTFIPSTDVCSASGDGLLYALFYQTGSAYKSSIIGTETSGSNTNVKRSISLGTGLSSQMAVHMGAQGSGEQGSSGGSGSSGRVSLIGQSSTGAMTKVSASPALTSWSHYVSWINQRD